MKRIASSPGLRCRGFTAVEVLVAMAISVLLLAGVLKLFANSRESYETNDRLARIQENGRYALELIARDVRAAGYIGCAKRSVQKPFMNMLNNSTQLLWNFALPVQGFDAGSSSWSPGLVAPVNVASLPDRDGSGPDVAGPAPGTDILVVRGPKRDAAAQRLQANVTSLTDALSVYKPDSQPVAKGDTVIIANCDQAAALQVTGYTVSGAATDPDTVAHETGTTDQPGNASASVGSLYPADKTEIYPVQTTVYFVDGKADGSGNSLWRFVSDSNASGGTAEEIIEGVDSLQVMYGVDTTNDRFVDSYVPAGSVTNWDQVLSVRVGLLVRSLEEYGPEVDSISRTLLGANIPAFNDRRQRMVFTTTATVRNRVFDAT